MKYFIHSSLLIGIFFLGGCSLLSSQENMTESETVSPSQGEDAISTSTVPEVIVQKLIPKKFGKNIEITGTLEAKEEITILSEVMGTVSKIHGEEGDFVKENDTIISLDFGSNLIQASYNTAADALKNAQLSYSLSNESGNQAIETAKIAVEQAEENIRKAEIKVEQARIQYQKIKNTNPLSLESQSTKTDQSQTAIEIAQKNLDLLRKTHSDLILREEERLESLLENLSNSLSKAFVSLRSDMVFADELIGASELRRKDNDSFEVYLIGREHSIIQNTKDLWNQTYPKLELLESDFKSFKKSVYTKDDEEALLKYLSSINLLIDSILEIERNIDTLLIQSIESESFTQEIINKHKASIVNKQNNLESLITVFENLEQSIENFHIESPQKISDLEIKISVAQSQLISANQNFSNISVSEESVNIAIDADLENAKQIFQEAESNLRNAEITKKSALSMLKDKEIKAKSDNQNAQTQIDITQNMLSQSSVNLSKLTITSGISGTLSSILVADGDTVTPGKPLALVSDFSELKLIADISVSESLLITEGDIAILSIEGISTPIKGKVSLIFPQADPITKRVTIEISIENTNKIPSNIFATATLQNSQEKEEIIIPKKSIIDIKKNAYVLIIEKNSDSETLGTVKKRSVELGEEHSGFVIISSGLFPSDFLILDKSKISLLDKTVQIKQEKDNNEDISSFIQTDINHSDSSQE